MAGKTRTGEATERRGMCVYVRGRAARSWRREECRDRWVRVSRACPWVRDVIRRTARRRRRQYCVASRRRSLSSEATMAGCTRSTPRVRVLLGPGRLSRLCIARHRALAVRAWDCRPLSTVTMASGGSATWLTAALPTAAVQSVQCRMRRRQLRTATWRGDRPWAASGAAHVPAAQRRGISDRAPRSASDATLAAAHGCAAQHALLAAHPPAATALFDKRGTTVVTPMTARHTWRSAVDRPSALTTDR